MVSIKNKKIPILLFFVLIKTVFSSYREHYIADEEINLKYIEFWELDTIKQSSVKNENGRDHIEIQFDIKQRNLANENKYIHGWNTSSYFGEFDSNKVMLLKFRMFER